jgi:hypothetical protein
MFIQNDVIAWFEPLDCSTAQWRRMLSSGGTLLEEIIKPLFVVDSLLAKRCPPC